MKYHKKNKMNVPVKKLELHTGLMSASSVASNIHNIPPPAKPYYLKKMPR